MRLAAYLAEDHNRCDDLFEQAQQQAVVGRWDEAAASFAAFHQAMERHFLIEEEVLFAAVESARGGPIGPTQQMRLEHLDLRDLAQEMADAAARRDVDRFSRVADAMRTLMRQHKLVEERVLFPMAEQILGADAPRVLADMRRIAVPARRAADERT